MTRILRFLFLFLFQIPVHAYTTSLYDYRDDFCALVGGETGQTLHCETEDHIYFLVRPNQAGLHDAIGKAHVHFLITHKRPIVLMIIEKSSDCIWYTRLKEVARNTYLRHGEDKRPLEVQSVGLSCGLSA